MGRLRSIITLLLKGEIGFIVKGISKRINSQVYAFGLKRDLKVEFENPMALENIHIRLAKPSDNKYFTEVNSNIGIVDAALKNCYLAVNDNDIPCYRQWLMGASENNKIASFFNGAFPVLKSNEALLEAAYTLSAYRGKRIMPAAMSRIAEKGKDINAEYIITFVDVDNIPSLKGCKRSGFHPYVLRTETWFLFTRRIRFVDIPSKLLDQYLLNVS